MRPPDIRTEIESVEDRLAVRGPGIVHAVDECQM
jgi:hypothetical protein